MTPILRIERVPSLKQQLRRKFTNLLGCALLVLAYGGTGLRGQQSPTTQEPSTNQPASTVSVDVKVVNVLATVRDKHGKIVPNLAKSDFTLEEDNHPVTIGYFAKETDLPLTLGLLVDTSLSQRRVLDQERSASKTFLDQVLREKDTAFVIHFDREVELLQDLTSSKPKLEAALELLHTPSMNDDQNTSDPNGQGSGQSGGGRRGGMHRGGGTWLYDAIYLASNELMLKQQGRKALIVLSDGVDHGSKESLETAIAAAQRADTVVYSVLFEDDEAYGNRGGGFGYPGRGGMGGGWPGGGGGGGGRRYPQEDRPDGKKVLERISKETGAGLYKVSKKEPIDQIYSSIEEELRNQYNLGFTPDKSDTPGYHKIVLKANLKDATVQTRDGFYAGSSNADR
jgi:VWFA-related protein